MAADPLDRHPLDRDEFSDLADHASRYEITVGPWPAVRRVDTHTPDGLVSSLVWGIVPRVVFLHGAGSDAHTWDATVLALGRAALAIDLPGHGHSAWRPDGRYDPRLVAAAVATVVERLAPDAAIVIGQGLGGFTAVALGDMRDDLVVRQLLVDTVPGLAARGGFPAGGGAESFASRHEMVERTVQLAASSSRAAIERHVVLATSRRDDGRWVWRHDPVHAGPGLAPADPAALWPSLASFPRPVTLVRAARGWITDDQAGELARRVPTAEIVTVDAGHDVQVDDPVGLAGIVNDRFGG